MSAATPGRRPAELHDVVVVGGGPAGATTALLAARAGLDVALVERRRLPATKVCGCCLAPVAVATLERLGVTVGIDPLRRLELRVAGAAAELPLHGHGVASREWLDHALVRAATAAGARLVAPAVATVGRLAGNAREVYLRDAPTSLRARVVVDATGLRRAGVPPDAGDAVGAAGSGRVGLGAHLEQTGATLPPGSVRMAAHAGDYLGVVALPGGGFNLAASVRAAVARPPYDRLRQLLELAGVWVSAEQIAWRATPALQAPARAPAAPRWLPVGDAMGFWEPFTGEGIAWALRGAERLAAELPALAGRWDERRAAAWRRDQRRWLRREQRRSRVVGYLAGQQHLARAAVAALAVLPGLAPLVLPGGTASPGLAVNGGAS